MNIIQNKHLSKIISKYLDTELPGIKHFVFRKYFRVGFYNIGFIWDPKMFRILF